MKAQPIVYMHGGLSIELVGETPFETTLLEHAFKLGHLKRGYGESECPSGARTGFFLEVPVTADKIETA